MESGGGSRQFPTEHYMETYLSLHIPGKVKHFVWKVLRGVLPCFGVLAGRHIPTSGECTICHVWFEDIQHCLFTCPRAIEIWSELGLVDVITKAVAKDWSGSVTMEIISRAQVAAGELPLSELVVVAAWYIWWQRRQLVKGENILAPNRTATAIKVICTNFDRATTLKQPVRKHDHMWKKPTSDVVKMNIDAAFQAVTLSGATGAIAWDGRGNFIAAATWFVPHVVGVDSAEMIAIRNGLYLAERIGCNKVIIESDTYVVEGVQHQIHMLAQMLQCCSSANS